MSKLELWKCYDLSIYLEYRYKFALRILWMGCLVRSLPELASNKIRLGLRHKVVAQP